MKWLEFYEKFLEVKFINNRILIFFNFSKDRLITEPLSTNDPSVLPSPEDLKYKVLIQVRK
jgi:hypothetical protein